MKLSKFFIFGLSACAFLHTSVSAEFIPCPNVVDIQCFIPEGEPKDRYECIFGGLWQGESPKRGTPLKAYPQPLTFITADNSTKSCNYRIPITHEGGEVHLKMVNRTNNEQCTAVTTPSPGFNCP